MVSGPALADIPGPRDECEVEGSGCEMCWEHYGSGESDANAFKECADAKKAKGFSEACRHRQGAGDAVFFCPEGKSVEKVTRGGGCAGCSVGEGGVTGALAALGIGAALAAVRRRKTRG
jgi:MYXO-CTERM domain-containing protein